MQDGIVTYERKDCSQVFFLFAGLGEMLMMNPVAFLRETGLSDRNVVMLKDALGKNYRLGVSDSINSFTAIVNWQREFISSRPHIKQVYVAGTSAGGAAALRSAHQLQAHAAWAFGARIPQEEMVPSLREHMDVLFQAKSTEAARKLFCSMPEEWRHEFFDRRENPARVIDAGLLNDLVNLLSVDNGVTQYTAYYCSRSPVDTFVANHFAGLPGFTVQRIDQPPEMDVPEFDTGHNVLRPLEFLGLLKDIFPRRSTAAA